MNHLLRELAPIPSSAWEEIETEARLTLKTTLAGRKLVDFAGPLGWDFSAVSLGRVRPVAPAPGTLAEVRQRKVLPLVELRVPFTLSRSELDALERGAKDFDTDPVTEAARAIAIAEDRAIFHGLEAAGIVGICEARADAKVTLHDDYATYPALIATALTRLRENGVNGPYAVALSEGCYKSLTESTTAGYPVLEHVRKLIDGPLIWAPGLDGALVISLRGGDFELTVGQDFSIGYLDHDSESVRLYLEESFTFWAQSPEAAVPLAFPPSDETGILST